MFFVTHCFDACLLDVYCISESVLKSIVELLLETAVCPLSMYGSCCQSQM